VAKAGQSGLNRPDLKDFVCGSNLFWQKRVSRGLT